MVSAYVEMVIRANRVIIWEIEEDFWTDIPVIVILCVQDRVTVQARKTASTAFSIRIATTQAYVHATNTGTVTPANFT